MGHVQRSAVMTTRDDFPRGRQPSLDEGLPMDRTAYPPLAEMALAPDREQVVESADGRTSVMSARDYAGEMERFLDAHPPSDGPERDMSWNSPPRFSRRTPTCFEASCSCQPTFPPCSPSTCRAAGSRQGRALNDVSAGQSTVHRLGDRVQRPGRDVTCQPCGYGSREFAQLQHP
jgi:hypothetical protein